MRLQASRSLPTAIAGLAFAMTTTAFAANPCDPLYQAGIKSLQTPHHVYSTTTLQGAKSRTGEAIFAGGVEYVLLAGQWRRSRMTPQDMIENAQEKLKTHPDTCSFVGDQTADGQAVSVFKAHSNDSGTDQVVRIVKSSGLMQGGTLTLPNGTVETRYDYSNVEAPAGAQ